MQSLILPSTLDHYIYTTTLNIEQALALLFADYQLSCVEAGL